MQLKKVDASSIGNTEVLWVAKKARDSEILRLEMVEKTISIFQVFSHSEVLHILQCDCKLKNM